MTDDKYSLHSKSVIRVSSRPSSLEEDEWAIKWVLDGWKSEHATNLGCFSFVTLILSGILAWIGFNNFGTNAGFGVLAISFAVLIVIQIAYIRSRVKAPSLIDGKPLGTIQTIFLPIEKAWRVKAQGYQKNFEGHFWLVRIVPGLNAVLLIDSEWNPQPYVSGTMPGKSIELDYYVFEERSLAVKIRFSHMLAARFDGKLDADMVGDEAIEVPVMCYQMGRNLGEVLDYGHPIDSDYCIEALLADLEHPANKDLCTIIRDDDRS